MAGDAKPGNIAAANMGIAGNDSVPRTAACMTGIEPAYHLQQRDDYLSRFSQDSERIGDQASREAWHYSVWFADFTYLCSPFAGDSDRGQLDWRQGREIVFAPEKRIMPLFLDSCGFRIYLTGSAPEWAKKDYPARYYEAIELLKPDGFAAPDNPLDRQETIKNTKEIARLFPGEKMWPVYSVRWAWNGDAHLLYSSLPGWRSDSLADLVPQTRTQRKLKQDTREAMARLAIANAVEMSKDNHLRWMVETFGKVMIGGMVNGPCPRDSRHIFAATLCEIFPDCQFWLLGQANFKVINGLGQLGLLGRVWTDGTWWIKDAICERFAYVDDGLITMMSFESTDAQKERRKKGHKRQIFFTLTEMMAANLRSIMAAYAGLIEWPPPDPLPIDLMDPEQVVELRKRYQFAQRELGL